MQALQVPPPVKAHTQTHTCTLNAAILFVKVTRFCQKQSLAEVKQGERETGSFNFCLSAIRLTTVWSCLRFCDLVFLAGWLSGLQKTHPTRTFWEVSQSYLILEILILGLSAADQNLSNLIWIAADTTLHSKQTTTSACVVWKMLIAYANWIQI